MLENREGGCHCGRVRFRAQVDLDLLSQCNCTVCTKKGILHLPVAPENFELLRGKNSLTTYTFGTGVAQHTFCWHCGMHAFYVPRSQPDRITVNARCLDDVDHYLTNCVYRGCTDASFIVLFWSAVQNCL